MIIVLGIIAFFIITFAIQPGADRKHAEWKKQNPNAAWYPGTWETGFFVIGGTFMMVGLIALLDPSTVQFVKEAWDASF